VFVSDDERAVVGTINLDYRSLYLHFECAAYIWKNPAVFDVEDDFQSTLKKCMRIDMQNCEEYSLVGKIVGKALKLVAPLM
jgi:cardiolipin synthase